MSTRRRLTPDERRTELLAVGTRLFDERPFDEVSMEDVAGRAAVSRALVYHYFPTKAALFAGIWQQAHDRLAAASVTDVPATVRDGIADALSRHLDFYREHPRLVFIANRSAIAADPAIRDPVRDDFAAIEDRVLDAAGATGRQRQLASACLTAWIAFVRELAIEWLLHERMSRDEAFETCMAALEATAGVHLDLEAAPVRS